MDEFVIKNEDELRAFNEMHGDRGYRARDARREAALMLVTFASTFAAAVAVFLLVRGGTFARRPVQEASAATEYQIASLQKRFDALAGSLAGGPQRSPDPAVADLVSQVQQVQADIQAFKSVLGDSPAKTLALPIMRKDIDDLKQRYRDDITAVRDESSRTLEAIKWIVGLLVMSNLGMGYLALTNGKHS
jgi:hypothetical protein